MRTRAKQQEVKILLVEDDKVDVMAVRRAFKLCQINNPLTVAGDGIDALDILRGCGKRGPLPAPYIIILDLNLPRMNGIQFLDELRSAPDLNKSIVFVLTTSKDEQDKTMAYSKNIAGYIAKSDFDNSFLKAVGMLKDYWEIIEFP